MDVRCDNCGTEYEFDDDKLTPNGVNVKCTSCGHVFRVAKVISLGREPEPAPAPANGDWMIRQASGSVFRFKELTTLQKWIVERKVSRDDEISRNGGTWKRLGQIPELGAFFHAVDKPSAGDEPSAADDFEDTNDDAAMLRATGGHRLGTAVVLVGIAATVFAASFVFRDRIAQLFGAGPVTQVASPAALDIEAGVRSYKHDTLASFASAETLLQKAQQMTPPSATAFATAAINQLAWVDALREQAQDVDTQIKDAAAGKVPMSVSDVAAQAATLVKLQGDLATRRERANGDIARASEIDAANDDLTRANARLAASKGDRQALLPIVERLKNSPLAQDEDILYSLALTDLSSPETYDNAAAALQKIVDRDADFIAARYKLAWIAVQKNDPRAALLLDEVLRRVPEHERAQALKKKLAPPAPASAPVVAPPTEPLKAPGKETFDQLLMRANAMRQRDRPKQALDLYDRALTLQPDNSEAMSGMGFCMLDLEQTQAAIGEFTKAIQANSRFSDAYMGLAEAYRAKNQKRDAVKNYQKYLDLTPDGPEAEVAKRALKDLGQGD